MESLRLSGLATGLDTSSLIKQLMQVERRPINQMQTAQKLAQSRIDMYRNINTKLVALQRAAEKVKGMSFAPAAGATTPTASVANSAILNAVASGSAVAGTYNFNVISLARAQITGGGPFSVPAGSPTASVTDPTRFTATADATAATGSYSVAINSLAQTQQSGGGAFSSPTITATSSSPAIATASVTGAPASGSHTVTVNTLASSQVTTSGTWQAPGNRILTITNTNGGPAPTSKSITFTNADDTIQEVVDKINDPANASGVTASYSGTGTGADPYKLILTGNNGDTYTFSGMAATRMRVNTGTTVAGSQASISVNGAAAITSSTNAFTAAVPGLSITASALGTTTLTVDNQTGSIRILKDSDGSFQDVAIAKDATITQVRDAINAAGSGMTASISGGALVLTGDAGTVGESFTISDAPGTAGLAARLGITPTIRTASLASLSIDGAAAITGTTNTFTNVLPGVTVNALATGTSTLNITDQAGTLRITNLSSGSAKDVAIQEGWTLAQVRDAINLANTGMTASDAGGVLTLTGGSTGVGFSIADADGGTTLATALGIDSATRTTQAAAQASLSVDGGAVVTSNSNTFTNPVNGLTVTASSMGATTVTVTLQSTASATDPTVEAVRDMVNKFNDVVGYIKENTGYNPNTKRSGALISDSTVIKLRQNLTRMFTGDVNVDDPTALQNGQAAGLLLQRDGTMAFDADKFSAALTANSTALKNLFSAEDGVMVADGNGGQMKTNAIALTGVVGDGIANRLANFVDSMISSSSQYNGTDAITGTRMSGALLGAIQKNELTISNLNKRIEEYEVRLADKERLLQTKFAAMERTVAMLRNQGNYLSSQFMGMNRG